jgi:acyl carrier protein
MTTTVPIGERVRATLRGRFADALDGVADGDLLRDALGERYDSLAATECITAIEGEFGITVDFVEDDLRHHFASIERISAFVRQKLEDLAALEDG